MAIWAACVRRKSAARSVDDSAAAAAGAAGTFDGTRAWSGSALAIASAIAAAMTEARTDPAAGVASW